MSVLTVDVGGANQTTLALQRGGHTDPRRVGGLTDGFAGSEESAIIAELMVIPFVTVPVDFATAKTVHDLFALGAQVNCAGDVFDNGGATIVCSADLTDEVDPTATWFTISGTLYEVENAATAYTPLTIAFYLTNVTSPYDPGDGSLNVASTNTASDPFAAGVGSETLLDDETIPTCGGAPDVSVICPTVISSAPERSWLSPATVDGGWITGQPTVYFLSGGGTGDHWELQDCMCKLYIVRAGVDVVEWDTAWSNGNGGFAGGTISMAAPAVVFQALPGDRVRVEVFGRAARHGGYNTTDLQTIGFGNGGGGNHYGQLIVGGNARFE